MNLYSTNFKHCSDPYEHWLIDDFLPRGIADEIYFMWPDNNDDIWHRKICKTSHKYSTETLTELGSVYGHVEAILQSESYISFLKSITGISSLRCDYNLFGAGMHNIPRGGFLKIHVDFNGGNKNERAVNCLLYMNKDWKPEYGGHLELWKDEKGTEKKLIEPLFNRMAIFKCTDDSWHGHPHPYKCPDHSSRKSIATYYYKDPEHEIKPHSTIYVAS